MIPLSYAYSCKDQDIISFFVNLHLTLRSIFKWSSAGLNHQKNCPIGSTSDLPVQVRQQGIIPKPHQKMPKVKTNSSAKKRFKITGTGEITFQKAFKRHILTKKSTKRKRLMAKKGMVSSANLDFVKRLLRLR